MEATKFGISKTGDWGYVGISFDNLESVYGIPFHGDEHEDAHGSPDGDAHADADEGAHADDDGDAHGGERIFSTTDSESTSMEGSYNLNGN